MNTQFLVDSSKKKKSVDVKMPQIFEENKINDCVRPHGFHGEHKPNEDCKCDKPSCKVTNEDTWHIFHGCWHSFHQSCVSPAVLEKCRNLSAFWNHILLPELQFPNICKPKTLVSMHSKNHNPQLYDNIPAFH